MLKLIPDYLKTKTMCKNTVEKLSFVIICVPDQYKTQEMCEKVILDNGRMSTLYRMGFLRAACGWGGSKSFPLLKFCHTSYIDENWYSCTLPKEDQKCSNHVKILLF